MLFLDALSPHVNGHVVFGSFADVPDSDDGLNVKKKKAGVFITEPCDKLLLNFLLTCLWCTSFFMMLFFFTNVLGFFFGFPPSLPVSSPPKTMSPPLEPQYLDVPYTSRPDRRLYLGKSSTLPTPDSSNPGRCVDMVSLPGGATPTHHQRWSNPGDSSPAWGTIEHTCCRPLTEYRMLPHEFAALHGKEWDGKQQSVMDQNGSLKRSCQLQLKVPRSVTEVDLSEPNVSSGLYSSLSFKQNTIKKVL